MQKSTPPSAGDHCRLTAPRALRLHGAVATRGARVSRRTLARWILRPVRARTPGAAGQWFKIETNSTLRTFPAGATWGHLSGHIPVCYLSLINVFIYRTPLLGDRCRNYVLGSISDR